LVVVVTNIRLLQGQWGITDEDEMESPPSVASIEELRIQIQQGRDHFLVRIVLKKIRKTLLFFLILFFLVN